MTLEMALVVAWDARVKGWRGQVKRLGDHYARSLVETVRTFKEPDEAYREIKSLMTE